MTDPKDMTAAEADLPPPCPRCEKPIELCVCADIVPLATRRHVLILQHPQEHDRDLGTARLTALHFRNATLKVGLSWPNLAKAVGRPVEARRWAVLYLGPAKLPPEVQNRPVVLLDRANKPLDPQGQQLVLDDLEGVILLDGSWSQAKTLWWRNAWLLKSWRIVLNPPRPSRYGRLRKEPRRESVSTIEATAQIMAALENRNDIAPALIATFEALLGRYRALKKPARGRPGRADMTDVSTSPGETAPPDA
jgi:DTW domain-containing protein